MIKDMSHKHLLTASALYGNILSHCLFYSKTVRKSIDRYWHRANKIRRKDRWVPRIVGKFDFHGRNIKIKLGKTYNGNMEDLVNDRRK